MRREKLSLMIMNIRQVRERARENGPGESVGEQIELSNQRDGSRGLPTTAHWPGLRVRYRIIAGNSTGIAVTIHLDAVHLSRRALEPACAPRRASAIDLSRDYPPLDLSRRGDEAARENARTYQRESRTR